MDVIELRVIITVVSFLVFLGIVFWAYSGSQKERFEEAANLPFADDEMQRRTTGRSDLPTGGESSGIAGGPSGGQSTSRSRTEQEITHG